jgi:hypothetical protein
LHQCGLREEWRWVYPKVAGDFHAIAADWLLSPK